MALSKSLNSYVVTTVLVSAGVTLQRRLDLGSKLLARGNCPSSSQTVLPDPKAYRLRNTPPNPDGSESKHNLKADVCCSRSYVTVADHGYRFIPKGREGCEASQQTNDYQGPCPLAKELARLC